MGSLDSNTIVRQVCILIFSLLFIILFPIALVLVLPIYLFRYVLSHLIKFIRPDLHKLIPTRSAVLAIDDPNQISPSWNLCVWLVLEGELNFEQFRQRFYKNIVLRKYSDGENLVYPELQQYYYKWLGFLFWKWEENFDIKDHIRYYYPEIIRQEKKVTRDIDLVKIIKEETWKGFSPKKAVWEFLYIQNYMENGSQVANKSVLIFRVHHGLCDGYSILRLLMKEVNNISMEHIAKPTYVERNSIGKFIRGLTFWLKGPYQLMEMLVKSNDINEWHKEKQIKPMNLSFSSTISLQYIKNIKNLHKVSFTGVLLAAITGGIRNTMIQIGINVPDYMHTAVACPIKNHPGKLRNHFIFSFVELPVGMSSAVQRLRKVESNLQHLKNSTVPYLNFSIIPLVGGWFTSMMDLVSHNVFSTALTSNFPGPTQTAYFIGGGGSNKVLSMDFNAGLGVGNVGVGFCLVSYNNEIKFISSADPTILKTDAMVDLLNQNIIQELSLLEHVEAFV